MGHFAGGTAQLAEVVDIWLHLRKWAGLDLLQEMQSSICLHSSWKKAEVNAFKGRLRMQNHVSDNPPSFYWSAFMCGCKR